MLSSVLLFAAFALSGTVTALASHQMDKRQACPYSGCDDCCFDDSPLSCWHDEEDAADQWYCAMQPHPGHQLGGVSYIISTSTFTASASAPAYTQSTLAAAPSASSLAVTCDIGREVCGSGCMWSSSTCCPSGQGSCDIGETCVTAADGTEGCCPLGETCDGSGLEASSTAALRPSSTAAYGGYGSSSSQYVGGYGSTSSPYIGGYGSTSSQGVAGPTGGPGGGSYTSPSLPAESSLPATQTPGSVAATNGMGSVHVWQVALGVVGVLFWR